MRWQNNNKDRIKYFTQEEATRLFKAMEKSRSKHALRDLAIFRVAYRCGLRASEIGLIKLENYNISKGEIYCTRLKGSNNNTIRLDMKTKSILDKYIHRSKLSDTSETLFQSQKNAPISRFTLDYLMKKYCRIARIPDKSKYHFHTIKHSTAVHLAESDMDIKELQWWLGHKSVSNTEIYFQFTTKQQEKMYEKLDKINEMV
ncbi:MAG: site-specific integrase [Clostridium sp.]|jgi:site-specific recombinase XerD|uniref:tyrosine-type recombinase/integrase n=1 Tax=Clostridium sp. TaxID=1506 RepID=UPI0025BD4E0A|nr:tyrosine-type recombinase/integrase [Clostridium sp.]MCH3964274.1 site-specific integrase [Clostridium sp.]MCI1715454.1 site-specific integrase [Clostridium sp.]MCI1799755.1 site-specific integrase [Clostridium sp.]MCI1813637.1 site-specific integrase [Clostridium sp.]MCI1870572.1 site-specific integrase [Clostridium sp.]